MHISYLYPDLMVNNVQDIELNSLHLKGFDTLLVDLDNTLVGWRAGDLSSQVLNWLETAKELNFKICIISNCLIRRRVSRFSRYLKIPAIAGATKPRNKGFLQAMKLLKSKAENSVVIGDQIFTDILGGNRLGLYTILVAPIDKREFLTTFVQRNLEKIVIRTMLRKGLLKRDSNFKSNS